MTDNVKTNPNAEYKVTFKYGDKNSNKKQETVKDYAEQIRVQDAEILGTYVEDFHAGEAAATRKQTGVGWAYYTDCRLDQVSMTELIKELIFERYIGRSCIKRRMLCL